MPGVAEDVIDEEIAKLEEQYEVRPFNIYTGVDRSVYTGTFALTNAAYRADAYTDTDSLLDSLFGDQLALSIASIGLDVVGLSIMGGALYHYKNHDLPAQSQVIAEKSTSYLQYHSEMLGTNTIDIVNNGATTTFTYDEFMTDCLMRYYQYAFIAERAQAVRQLMAKLPDMSTFDKYLQQTEVAYKIYSNMIIIVSIAGAKN